MYGTFKLRTVCLIMLMSFLFPGSLAFGQSTENGGFGYSLFGRNTIGMDDFNSALAGNGYSELLDSYFLVGGGGHAIINSKWILGGEGYSLLGEEATSGDYTSSMIMACGFFDVGYIVYTINQIRVYPLIGIGGGGINFNIAEDVSALSFNDVLENPNRIVTLSASSFLLNFSIGLDYLLNFSQEPDEKAGMLLGVRLGYMVSPSNNRWSMGDVEISGAPNLDMTRPYFRVVFGGGAIEIK